MGNERKSEIRLDSLSGDTRSGTGAPGILVDFEGRLSVSRNTLPPELEGQLFEAVLGSLAKALRLEGWQLFDYKILTDSDQPPVGQLQARGDPVEIRALARSLLRVHQAGSLIQLTMSIGGHREILNEIPVPSDENSIRRIARYSLRQFSSDVIGINYQRLMLRALLTEACLSPKPGLVDPESPGPHKDMVLSTLLDGAAAIHDLFALCAQAGFLHRAPLPDLFEALRPAGQQAEERMLRFTQGVNTHRGLIFCGGIACAAAGFAAGRGLPPARRILSAIAKRMTAGIAGRELAGIQPESKGQSVFVKYGAAGARGEAEAGFPGVVNGAMPALDWAYSNGLCRRDAALMALLSLISRIEDTVLLTRGGATGLQFARTRSGDLTKLFIRRGAVDHGALRALDHEFTLRNLSPGGSADLLTVALFWHDIERGEAQSAGG